MLFCKHERKAGQPESYLAEKWNSLTIEEKKFWTNMYTVAKEEYEYKKKSFVEAFGKEAMQKAHGKRKGKK